MKKLISSLFACVLTCQLTWADITIVQKVEGLPQEASGEITMKIKDGKMRMDVEKQGVSMIMDNASGSITNILHAQKMYMTVPAEMAKMAAAQMGVAESEKASEVKFEATGRKETINGFPCEEYRVVDGDSSALVWFSKDIPGQERVLKEYTSFYEKMDLPGEMKGMEKAPGFPIRMATEVEPGKEVTVTTVSISADPVSADAFEVPKDYQAMQLPFGQ